MYSSVSTSQQSPNTDLHTSTYETMTKTISYHRARHVRDYNDQMETRLNSLSLNLICLERLPFNSCECNDWHT